VRDVLDSLDRWREAGEQIAVATVVETWGSSPRPPGAKMALTITDRVAGSVSAGCVEGAVIQEGQTAVRSGAPRLLTYGVADEAAWDVGLTCGGTIKVWVEPFAAFEGVYDTLAACLRNRQPCVLVGPLEGPPKALGHKLLVGPDGPLAGDLDLGDKQDRLIAGALECLSSGKSGAFRLGEDILLFADVYLPPPRLIVVGAVHIAEILVPMADLAGFDTVVIDPRGTFASPDRFPDAGELVRQWPHRVLADYGLDISTFLVLLTHDPKIDDPALKVALASGARYIGVLGSRRTHQQRVERLRADGLTEAQLARLHAPIGLSLGGRTPAEIAVSILAEIVQARNSPAPGSEGRAEGL
jgi:xanthine dehydrogenase accessory factor